MYLKEWTSTALARPVPWILETSFCYNPLGSNELIEQAWVVQTPNIPKTGMFSGRALGWLLGRLCVCRPDAGGHTVPVNPDGLC